MKPIWDTRFPAAQPGASRGLPPVTEPDARVRWDLIWRVRREIAAGELESPQKWAAVVDRLLQVMD